MALEQGLPCPSLSFQNELWLSLRCAPASLSQIIWEKEALFYLLSASPWAVPSPRWGSPIASSDSYYKAQGLLQVAGTPKAPTGLTVGCPLGSFYASPTLWVEIPHFSANPLSICEFLKVGDNVLFLYLCTAHSGASLVAQIVKNLPAMQETRV